MQESRLQRSYEARMRNRDDILAFCNAHGIVYTTDYHDKTQPSEAIRKEFREAYAVHALPQTDLPLKGASTVLVFESKQSEKQHGEMVASVADRVGQNLEPGVETLYIHAALNPHYRQAFEPHLVDSVNELIENQGVPVIHTSIGWNDLLLSFQKGLEEQTDAMWKITAFVVDSAGNDGRFGADGTLKKPEQKHNAVSHSPPLVVHVGAAVRDKQRKWSVEGYSSANSPTLVAPVAPEKKALWDKNIGPEGLTGTSIAAPYVSGALAALNRRYGPYLTREQILYAVLATCERVEKVEAFAPQTPESKELTYITNKAGLSYNPEYAGFGLISPHKADRLLAQMVRLTQENPQGITVPVEERIKVDIPDAHEPHRGKDGLYTYSIRMPAGIALKTTLNVEFAKELGDVQMVSPAGTRLPLVMSRLNSDKESFGISTTHGWAGEELKGAWKIESTTPIKCLQLNQHHFKERDIVSQLDIPALLMAPKPSLHHAKRLTELAQEHMAWRHHRSVEFAGMTVASAPPDLRSAETMIAQLNALPSAFSKRNRIYTPQDYFVNGDTLAGREEAAGQKTQNIQEKVNHFKHAAEAYKHEGRRDKEALMLSFASDQLLRFIAPYNDNNAIPAQEAVTLLERAATINKEEGHLDLAYFNNCRLYAAHSRIYQHCETLSDTEGMKCAAIAMERERSEAKRLHEIYMGGADPTAYRVEEGEIGFSDRERIGTDNVSQCLTIIARDPVTNKTGLAHLDNQSNIRSLEQLFNHFSHNKLEVRLIGASHDQDAHSSENIMNVMRYLANKNVNIISADIMRGPSAPAAMVVDPKTFAVEERVPAIYTPNAGIGNAVLEFTEKSKPLEVQFDFTRSKERYPIFLNRNALDFIRKNFVGKNEAELERYYLSEGYYDRPLVVAHTQVMMEAYEKEWSALCKTLEQTIACQHVDDMNAHRARNALAKQRFFIGENASEANDPIHQWIKKDLLVNGECKFAALNGVRLDNRTHRLVCSSEMDISPTVLGL